MRRPLLIIICVAGIFWLGLSALQWFYWTHEIGWTTRTYETLEEAIRGGVFRQGWLPAFLPRSAFNIREKRNSEYNTVIASCSFDPADNLLPLLAEAEELPLSALSTIRPPSAPAKKGVWLPRNITKGKFGALAADGFRFYRSERVERAGPHQVTAIWHVAINQREGVCYLWFNQKSPVSGPESP